MIRFLPVAVAGSAAWAQAEGKLNTLGGKSTSIGKVMTRDELRACIKQQEDLNTRKTTLEKRQIALKDERTVIQKENDAIKAEQDGLNARKGNVDDLNKRMAEHAERVKDLNQRSADFEQAGRSGPNAERERRKLDKERADIEKAEAALKTEREQVSGGNADVVAKLNARVDAQQQVASDWNTRSKKVDQELQTYENDRGDWVSNCGERRYREDDEKAIRAGK
jgi:predicted  nucleic acid-binding Zn-ribbon protein